MAAALEARGSDGETLRALSQEVASMHEPSTARRPWHARALETARAQFAHALGELGESADAVRIIRRALKDPATVTARERDHVKSQLLDVFRAVPASALAAANAALPIPGTSLATPWLLTRLGLMPSRWRESYILDRLQREHDRLLAMGLVTQAGRLSAVSEELRDELTSRDICERDVNLLRFWDANGNHVWDAEERAAYDAATQTVAKAVRTSAHRKQWFCLQGAQVVGPFVLAEGKGIQCLSELPSDGLICYRGTSGWVCVHDLRDVLRAPDACADA